jgi:hypothetical protein
MTTNRTSITNPHHLFIRSTSPAAPDLLPNGSEGVGTFVDAEGH